MANWDKITSMGNVEDRRGMGGAGILAGGGGLIALLITLGLGFFGVNISPDTVQQILGTVESLNGQATTSQTQPPEFAGKDSYEVFSERVLGSTNDTWNGVFGRNNMTYQEPTLVLFRDATRSGCGVATSAVGPHFCPSDGTIYLDETFFDELKQRFGGSNGDVAQAYVIAHEVGHNVQAQLGAFGADAQMSNAESVQVELQADCYAGIWAYSLKDKDVFKPGDINQAIDAASAVGDDRIQQKAQGYTNPETFTHGSSKQRVAAFERGYTSGQPAQCKNF